jgi:hypothetical protein
MRSSAVQLRERLSVYGLRPLGRYIDDRLHTATITQGGYWPNEYDQALDQDYALWKQILRVGGLERICLPLGQRPYLTKPWATMPDGGREFSPQTQTLVSSVVEGTETTILSFETPFGYDGVINFVVANCLPTASAGSNFTEGSGQITWRLKANGRHLRDWGDVLTSRGSLLNPSPIPERGLRIYSRNLIELTVTLQVASGLNASSNLVAMVMGWFYPR